MADIKNIDTIKKILPLIGLNKKGNTQLAGLKLMSIMKDNKEMEEFLDLKTDIKRGEISIKSDNNNSKSSSNNEKPMDGLTKKIIEDFKKEHSKTPVPIEDLAKYLLKFSETNEAKKKIKELFNSIPEIEGELKLVDDQINTVMKKFVEYYGASVEQYFKNHQSNNSNDIEQKFNEYRKKKGGGDNAEDLFQFISSTYSPSLAIQAFDSVGKQDVAQYKQYVKWNKERAAADKKIAAYTHKYNNWFKKHGIKNIPKIGSKEDYELFKKMIASGKIKFKDDKPLVLENIEGFLDRLLMEGWFLNNFVDGHLLMENFLIETDVSDDVIKNILQFVKKNTSSKNEIKTTPIKDDGKIAVNDVAKDEYEQGIDQDQIKQGLIKSGHTDSDELVSSDEAEKIKNAIEGEENDTDEDTDTDEIEKYRKEAVKFIGKDADEDEMDVAIGFLRMRNA